MRQSIEITKLFVNHKNFRFDPVENEKAAIDLMLLEKESEILNLAKHVTEYGLDPSKDIRVIQEKNAFLALDGNRRITTVKCLSNPSLIKKESLKEEFQKLSSLFIKNPIKEINCFVFPDEKSASVWLGLDHTGKNKGAGQDSWESEAIGRFRANFGQKQQLPISMQALEMLKQNKINVDERNVNTTTADRVLSNPEARSFLGIDVIKGKLEIISNKDESLGRLKIFFEKIINTKVGDVYNKVKIESFLTTLFGEKKLKVDPKKALPLFDEAFEKGDKNDSFENGVEAENESNNTKENGDTSYKEKSERSKKIPVGLFLSSDIPFKLSNTSLRAIYEELKSIPVASYPNATHDLLRSFLECSLVEYLTEKNEYQKIQQSPQQSPKLSELLTHIINTRSISDNHILDNLKSIKSDFDKPYSLARMNAVNHNKNYTSTEKDVRQTWGKLEGLFKVILNYKI